MQMRVGNYSFKIVLYLPPPNKTNMFCLFLKKKIMRDLMSHQNITADSRKPLQNII